MDHFELVSEYSPTGDQPQAIEKLVEGFKEGNQFQTLLGVTGSGKTFTMANVIQKLNKPTLIIAHNKTLAAQLYLEMKEFFPNNAVEYFVSYYDYYQPEAYVPSTDTYIEKDSSINDEIDKLRHSATAALSERQDVIIVASVSCIYGLGSPIDYKNMVISLRPGMEKDRDEVIHKLIDIQYSRNDMDFKRGSFRVRGDVLEVYPAYSGGDAYRIEFFGDEVDRIMEIDTVTGEVKAQLGHVAIFPASHYVVPQSQIQKAADAILEEMKEQGISRALICDEFGMCQGIITLRDILEALLGTINDTQKEPEIIQRSNNDGWLVDGQCSFYDFLSYFDKEDLYERCNYHTVGGLLLEQLGHIPQSGEQAEWNNFRFEIVDMDGARIDKILVQVPNDNNA